MRTWMDSLVKKPVLWVTLAATALVAVAALVMLADYRDAVQSHRNSLLECGKTLAEALTAGMRAQGRMARARGERINVLFEEAADIPGVRAVRLTRADGTSVAAFGEDIAKNVPPLGEPDWGPDTVAMTVETELSPVEEAHGGNMHPWQVPAERELLPAGPYRIALVLDAQRTYQEITRERVRFGIALAAVSCAAVAAVGLIVSQMRQMALEVDLSRATEIAAENERLARLGAGLAHETKNPLNVVRGLAQGISTTPALPPSAHADATRILDEVDRTVGHINGFLALSRPKPAHLERLELDAVFKDVLALVCPEAREKNVALECGPCAATILADRDLLRRALLNLLVNALRACSADCTVWLAAVDRDGLVDIQVEDNGCGIAKDDLAHVKEPYFSRFEGGTGLGLAIVDQIARAHGVTLELVPIAGGGTCACLAGFREVD